MLMWYLYVLKNSSNRHYIGITQDKGTRLEKHNSGGVRSTKAYRPWTVDYSEAFETKKEARIREIELKANGYKRKQLFEKI